jgi:hypothetical protein
MADMIRHLSPVRERCPLANKFGDTICIDGQLWSLTYSECAPPDQRQCMGPCSWNGHKEEEWQPKGRHVLGQSPAPLGAGGSRRAPHG